jgi:hypothetical protein
MAEPNGVTRGAAPAYFRRWLQFKGVDHVIRTARGGAECAICVSNIKPDTVHFVIIFKREVHLRLDRGCVNLWCDEIARVLKSTTRRDDRGAAYG